MFSFLNKIFGTGTPATTPVVAEATKVETINAIPVVAEAAPKAVVKAPAKPRAAPKAKAAVAKEPVAKKPAAAKKPKA